MESRELKALELGKDADLVDGGVNLTPPSATNDAAATTIVTISIEDSSERVNTTQLDDSPGDLPIDASFRIYEVKERW